MHRLIRAIVPAEIARYRAPGHGGFVALTFDDGPVSGLTERIARTLHDRGHAATFFVEGRRAERSIETLRAIRGCGSEIANHMYSHQFLSRLSWRDVSNEITKTDAIIRAVQPGVQPLLRPPFGEVSPALLWFMLTHRRGLTMWTHVVGNSGRRDDPNDKSPGQIADAFDAMVIRDGDIVLMHDWCGATVEALPRILDCLEARRMRSVTLSMLCGSRRALSPARAAGEEVSYGYHHD